MVALRREVLEQAFEHLRRCGAGRDECIVYLTGPVDAAGLIDGSIHPRHTASPGGYDLNSEAIAAVWTDLAASRRTVRMQVHTHPGAAYHSARDDDLALVQTPGFLSLVIPRFALGGVGFDGAFLAERDDDGGWVEVPVEDRVAVAS